MYYSGQFDELLKKSKNATAEHEMSMDKVFSGWAFKENEREKALSNIKIFLQLKEKYKIKQVSGTPTEQELLENDFVYSVSVGYKHWDCTVYKAPAEMSVDEQALVIDGGSLCFGYSYSAYSNIITISTD